MQERNIYILGYAGGYELSIEVKANIKHQQHSGIGIILGTNFLFPSNNFAIFIHP